MSMDVRPDNHQLLRYKTILHQYLTKEEIKSLHEKSNWKAAWEVAKVWLWIIFAFVLAGAYPNPFTILIALFILGGKQLGCAIIMHDASHLSLFKTKRLNETIGNWLGAYPVLQNVKQYRPYHLQHHVATGTDDDPDINLTKGYPTTAKSMLRKFLRDFAGASGIKGIFGVIMMHLGYLKYNLGNLITKIPPSERTFKTVVANGWKNLHGPLAFQMILLGILWLSGHAWLYLLWWAAYITTNNFSLRVRSIAEHSVVEDRNNPLRNTRTTYANFIERILFAPLNVNYHLEHHFMVAAPCYNYPKLHKMLKERGFYKEALLAPNYREIIKMAITQ